MYMMLKRRITCTATMSKMKIDPWLKESYEQKNIFMYCSVIRSRDINLSRSVGQQNRDSRKPVDKE
jgi:hypothetical protein